MEDFTRGFEAIIDDVQESQRSIVAKINTDGIDRYRTVITPQGAILDGYRANPVVLWEHGQDPTRGTRPIGKNKTIEANKRGIIAKTIFKDDAYSMDLFKCYQDGWIRGWSVRMVNPKYSAPTPDEIRSRPELRDCELVFREWELGEYSGTVLPGNKDTLTMLESRGIWMPEHLRGMANTPVIPDVTTVDKEDETVAARSAGAPYVQEKDGAWHVFSADGTRAFSVPTSSLADECLRLMKSPSQSWVERHISESLGATRRLAASLKQDVVDYINLARYGRV